MDWTRWRRPSSGKPVAVLSVKQTLDVDDVAVMVALQLGADGSGLANDQVGLDEVPWNRKTVDRLVRAELHDHGWSRYWFMGDFLVDEYVSAVRDRVVGVYPEAGHDG